MTDFCNQILKDVSMVLGIGLLYRLNVWELWYFLWCIEVWEGNGTNFISSCGTGFIDLVMTSTQCLDWEVREIACPAAKADASPPVEICPDKPDRFSA